MLISPATFFSQRCVVFLGLGGREIVPLPPMNTGDRGSGGTAPVAPSPHPRGLLRKGRRRDCTSGSPPPHTDGDTHIMASSMHKTTGPRGGRLCGCAAAAGLRRSFSLGVRRGRCARPGSAFVLVFSLGAIWSLGVVPAVPVPVSRCRGCCVPHRFLCRREVSFFSSCWIGDTLSVPLLRGHRLDRGWPF